MITLPAILRTDALLVVRTNSYCVLFCVCHDILS